MPSTTITVNGKKHIVEADAGTPLLWILRDHLRLTGTKFACGSGFCGSCTVHLESEAARACVTTLAEARGKKITTIEGLAASPQHALVRAWIEEEVPQCGYCQSGQIMEAAALLARHPHPTDSELDGLMSTVLCRCGTYLRIRRAIRRAASAGGGQ